MAVLIVIVLFSIVPFILYFGQGGGHGPSWGLVAAGEQMLGVGAYRQQPVMRWKRGSAPLVVRAAALTCFYLGQMVVPGGFLALVGLGFVSDSPSPAALWMVLELSAPTGMIAATFLLAAGWAMLEGDQGAVAKARQAWRWGLCHNLGLLTALGVALAADPRELGVWCFLPCLYACVSLAQALLLRRAAAAIAAYDAARTRESPPLDVEAAVLAETG